MEPGSFDIQKKDNIPVIVILDCLDINIEISDVSMETEGFGEYREVLEINRVTNSMLAKIHSRPVRHNPYQEVKAYGVGSKIYSVKTLYNKHFLSF